MHTMQDITIDRSTAHPQSADDVPSYVVDEPAQGADEHMTFGAAREVMDLVLAPLDSFTLHETSVLSRVYGDWRVGERKAHATMILNGGGYTFFEGESVADVVRQMIAHVRERRNGRTIGGCEVET